MTAATLRLRSALPRTLRPMRSSIDLHRLLGERRVAQRVAGALQADHQAVADELVVARAAQRGDVLDAHGRADGVARPSAQQQQGDEKRALHPPLTSTAPSALHAARDRDAAVARCAP